MKISFNPSTAAALTVPPDNTDITFDLTGHNIFARGVKFSGTDTSCNIIDNLTSTDASSALSANMGRLLNLTKTPYNNTSSISSALSSYNIEICPSLSTWYSSLNIPDSGGGLLIRGNTGTAFNLWLHDNSNVWYKQTASGAWKKMDAGHADSATYSLALKSTGDDGNWYNWVYYNGSYFWLKAGTQIYDNSTATLKTAVDYSTVSSYLLDNGVHGETASGTTANAANAGMLYGSGMYMTRVYNSSGVPTSYGNMLNLAGGGSSLLLLGWSGSDSTTASIYYRSHRDTSTGGWGSWRRLFFADELPSSMKNPNAIIFRDINGTTVSYDGSAKVDLSAGTYIAKLPYGFSSWASGVTWGNTTGTSFASWNDPTGGSIDFRRDNPSSGKMSIKVDGRVYVNEGYNPVLSSEHNNGFWGMRTPDGGNDWIRTPNNGLIPYVSGAAGSGHSSLGTSSWYFSTAYIDSVYGSLKGNADSATNADKVDGYHAGISLKPFGTIPAIGSDGVMEIGHYLDFHYNNTSNIDYSTRLTCLGDYKNNVYLPTGSGTLALTSLLPSVSIKYYAKYYISMYSSSVFLYRQTGNFNFVNSMTKSREGSVVVNMNYPSGYNQNSTFMWGLGVTNSDIGDANYTCIYVTIVPISGTQIYVNLADDDSLNNGICYIYFLCF